VLWREVIEYKYGGWRTMKDQRVRNNKASLWWRDLKKIWKSEKRGGKFEDYYNWEVENGEILCSRKTTRRIWSLNRFPRSFSLFYNKEAKLSVYGVSVNNVW